MLKLGTQSLIMAGALTLMVVAGSSQAQTAAEVTADRDCPGAGCPHAIANAPGAGPVYTADDIIEHFKGGTTCPEGQACLPKGMDRAVCIGTVSDCKQSAAVEAAAPDPGGFDLLITFELGSDRLSPQAQVNLTEFAKAMSREALASVLFSIDGHTDARGADSYNIDLSNRRAAAVVAYLEKLGVPRNRLFAQGFGESKPRVPDPFAAINRRVEASIKVQ